MLKDETMKRFCLPLFTLSIIILATLACGGSDSPATVSQSETSKSTQSPTMRSSESIPAPTSTSTPALAQSSPTASVPPPTPTYLVHVVQAGETLGGIAKQYGVPIETLVTANNISDPSLIRVGQEIVIPSTDAPTSTSLTAVTEPIRIPSAAATHGVYPDIQSLANGVVGSRVQSSLFDYFPDPSGRTGYDVDLTVTSPGTRTREEMLQMAYDLAYEFYYNYADSQPYFLVIHLRAPDDISCVFGLGIGYAAVPEFLPADPPDDLEAWFGALVASRNYADLPGQSEEFMAYGNDPTSKPYCAIDHWKK